MAGEGYLLVLGANMVTQVVGTLISIAGSLWVCFVLSVDFHWGGEREAALSLWGVIAFLAGLVLWALGRIECAIGKAPEQNRQHALLSLLLLSAIMLTPVALMLFYLYSPGR